MQDGQSLAGRDRRVALVDFWWLPPVDDIPHRQTAVLTQVELGGVIDLGGIRQSECGREPIVGSDRRLARRYSVAQVLSGRDSSSRCTWTVARWLADLTVDVRWRTRNP